MKKLVYTIIICVLAVFVWQKFDLAHYKEKVKIATEDLNRKKELANEMVNSANDARQELFQVLTLMNEMTINTMKLEMIGEGNVTLHDTTEMKMRQQLEEQMRLLKEQLAEAREMAKENQTLVNEIERLQNSLAKREETIQLLKSKSKDLDAKLKVAISQLESENEALSAENQKLSNTNRQIQSTIFDRKRAEMDAWILAGDELVVAAKIIPKANSLLFSGSQSQVITRSKQLILKSATECYNMAIRMGNASGDRTRANNAHAKAVEADRLFNLVTNNQSIGEERYD